VSTLAAVDLGSNTIKLTVAEIRGGELTSITEWGRITRIGRGLDKTGKLDSEAVEKTLEALAICRDMARGARIRCVATAGLRGASDAGDFIERARQETGIEIEIIDGLREAELAFRGPAARYPGPLIVLDVGGRSTELVSGEGAAIEARASLPLGGVALTERFFAHDPPLDEELEACALHARTILEDAPRGRGRLIGVSGTIHALAGIELGVDDIETAVERGEGLGISRAKLDEVFRSLAAVPAKDRIRGTIIPSGRADVIVAAIAVVREVMDRYGTRELIASKLGVRYGLLAEMAGT